MRNKLQLVLTVIFICLFSAAAYAVSIWGASDRAPATGTMRLPVDTTSSSSPGYLEVQDIVDLTYASGVGSNRQIIFNSGGTLTGASGLTYSAGGLLTASSFAGSLVGNSSTATALAANGSNCSAGSAPLGVDVSGAAESCTDYEEDLSNSAGLRGALSDESGTGAAYFQGGDLGTPSAGVLTNATGTATGLTAGAATLAANSTIVDSTDATSFPLIVDSATGDLALKTDGGLLYDASNGTLSSTIFNTPTLTLTGTGTLNGLDAIDGTTETTLEAALDLVGDVSSTGLGSTAIGADKITEAMLKAVDAASDEECLTYETTTGDFEWQTCGGGGGGSYANSAALAADLSDETGTGVVAFSDSPVFTTQITTPLIALSGTGTLNGLDAIDGTTETTLEAALDIAGDVSGTGLGSVVIGADKVLESMLKAVDTAADEECLTYETTTGDFEWQSCGGGGSLSDGDKGDIVVTGSGATWSIDTGVIVNADVNASAAIDATKIHDGSISNTEFGYLNGVTSNIQTQIDGLTATGFAAYTDGGTNSFAVDASFTSTIDADSDTSFAIGVNNAIGAARGHDWVTAIGSDITADGNAVVVIGRLGVVDCVNGVSIGDGNTLNCNGGVTEKSAIFGNDNNYSGVMDHFYGIGSNNTSTTGCRQCGIFGENITNDKNGSFGIGNPSLSGGSVTVGSTNTIWFPDDMYIRMGGLTEASFATCNSTRTGQVQYNQSEGALNVCDGSAWQSIPQVPASGANNVAISQYAMTYLDETSEANLKAAINAEAGVDFQAYDADLATLATGGAAFTALAGNATKPDLYADLGAGYEKLCFPGSDFNSTALTASAGVVDETPPLHATFTVTGVYAYVRTAPTGTLTIDINEGAGAGTSILSTKITIDSGEYNGGSSGYQGTAAAAAVISDTSIASFAHITADIDSTTGGKGLMVCLVGYY